ncbi:MAG: hypothetical protein Ct9H90mP22_8020 [Gammaproteobacteria bacterium]|nr:MAG: hypothetical protein Ct9H90mP22_8020 [Gammaproteobacteria bacterium]
MLVRFQDKLVLIQQQKLKKKEKNLEDTHFEFFSVNSGVAEYKGAGMSINKTSANTQKIGYCL